MPARVQIDLLVGNRANLHDEHLRGGAALQSLAPALRSPLRGCTTPPESLRTMTTDALACTDFCVRAIHYPLPKLGKPLQSINRDACAWSNFCAGKMQKIFLHLVAGMPLPFITIDFHKGVNLHSAPPPRFQFARTKICARARIWCDGCQRFHPPTPIEMADQACQVKEAPTGLVLPDPVFCPKPVPL